VTEEKDEMIKRWWGKIKRKGSMCESVRWRKRDYLRTGSLVQSFRDEATI